MLNSHRDGWYYCHQKGVTGVTAPSTKSYPDGKIILEETAALQEYLKA